MKAKTINGVIIGGETENCPHRMCPHCGVDLIESGVDGWNSVDFSARPFEEDLSYEDSWYTKFEGFDGATIHCSDCHEAIQVTGPYAAELEFRAKYHALIGMAATWAGISFEDVERAVECVVFEEVELDG